MEERLQNIVHGIQPANEGMAERAIEHLNQLTKPQGSLGRLEELAVQLAQITGEVFPSVTPPGVIVFAGDHGVAEEGVSAYPQEVTAQMVLNFVHGGAAINAFSRQIGAIFQIVDMGVAGDVPKEGVIHRKIRRGTANFTKKDAMTRDEAVQSVMVGYEMAQDVINQGGRLLILGEMGIANTTPSTAILAAVSNRDAAGITGYGTGIDEHRLDMKRQLVNRALAERSPDPKDPLDILAKVGGLEIGGIAGAMLGAAQRRVPVLLDGFICTSAALLACMMCENVGDYLIAGHLSQEPGHQLALELLRKKPLLALDMRLGEGSGAAVAFPVVEAATRMMKEMATFTSSGVATKVTDETGAER